MLIDSTFWPQFYQAKDALFTALLNPNAPPFPHILSTPRSQHYAIRTETTKLISSLLELEHELEVIQREVKRFYESISQQRMVAEMSLRPIGVLPPETIREIVLHTVEGPHDHRQILRLSHVSTLWRDAVLGISTLFTQANWIEWPTSLVDTWCSRAGSRLLKVFLGRSMLEDHPRRHSLHALLAILCARVGELEIIGGSVESDDDAGVLEFHMPSLEYLIVRSHPCYSPEFWIGPENIPALRVLELTALGASITPPATFSTTIRTTSPLPNITDLRYPIYSLNALEYHGTNILFNVPNLRQLALEVKHLYGVPNVEHRIVLPSLTSLEVRLMTTQRIDDVLHLFAAFSVPNLRSLALDFGFGRYDYVTLQSLVWT